MEDDLAMKYHFSAPWLTKHSVFLNRTQQDMKDLCFPNY